MHVLPSFRFKQKKHRRKVAWKETADSKPLTASPHEESNPPNLLPESSHPGGLDDHDKLVVLATDPPVDHRLPPPLFFRTSEAKKLPEDIPVQQLEVRRLDMNASYILSSQSDKEVGEETKAGEEENVLQVPEKKGKGEVGSVLQPPAFVLHPLEDTDSAGHKVDTLLNPTGLDVAAPSVAPSDLGQPIGHNFISVVDIEDDSSIMLDPAPDRPQYVEVLDLEAQSSITGSDRESGSQVHTPLTEDEGGRSQVTYTSETDGQLVSHTPSPSGEDRGAMSHGTQVVPALPGVLRYMEL